MRDRPDRPRAPWLLWLERLLLTTGAGALVLCAVLVSDALVAQRSARRVLEAASNVERPVWPPTPATATDVRPPAPALHRGAPVATLWIPRVELSAVVLHGSDAQTLRRGPGHLENTPLPGQPGNVVIAGHRDSFFWPLRNIRLGDDIFLDTPRGRVHYEVTSVRVVKPHDISVLAPTARAIVTLITCYPFWVFGNAPDRFVVRAAAVVNGATGALAPHETPAGDSTGTAVIDAPVVQGWGELEIGVHDDQVLVRLAVERYRLVYNRRLVSRHEVGSGGLLEFQTCEVAVAGDRATALCEARPESSSDPEPNVRAFTLERAAGGWAIRSIAVK